MVVLLRFSDPWLGVSLWHFAMSRCAMSCFPARGYSPFPLNLLPVWNTILRQPFLHCYTSWDPTQTKSQWEKVVEFLVPSHCCGILRFRWSDWQVVSNGGCPGTARESVRPVLRFGETSAQHQSASAHVAPMPRSCKVKVTGAGCVYRRVYPAASLAVEAHARKWF